MKTGTAIRLALEIEGMSGPKDRTESALVVLANALWNAERELAQFREDAAKTAERHAVDPRDAARTPSKIAQSIRYMPLAAADRAGRPL